MAVDEDGNVLVVGYETGVSGSKDIWVRKYDVGGAALWTQTYEGSASGSDVGHAIAVDAEGNALVTGYETGLSGASDIWVRKYGSDGTPGWTQGYNGIADHVDEGYGIAVDSIGNVLVTGSTSVAVGSTDIWVRKYDSEGTPLWTRTHDGGDYEGGWAVAVDSNGNALVVGDEDIVVDGIDIWVRKYDPDGNVLWTRTYSSSGSNYDGGTGVAVDRLDNVLVTGFDLSDGMRGEAWVRKYDSWGDVLWTRDSGGPTGYSYLVNGVAADAMGNVVVTGREGSSAGLDSWTRKYDPDGATLWTRTHAGAADGDDTGWGIATGPDGSVVVAGSETAERGDLDAWVRKYWP